MYPAGLPWAHTAFCYVFKAATAQALENFAKCWAHSWVSCPDLRGHQRALERGAVFRIEEWLFPAITPCSSLFSPQRKGITNQYLADSGESFSTTNTPTLESAWWWESALGEAGNPTFKGYCVFFGKWEWEISNHFLKMFLTLPLAAILNMLKFG